MFIKLNNISKSYKTRLQENIVFENLSFNAEYGEFIAIMGNSGCGKSTLLRILGCLDSFDNGEYYFKDKNIKEMSNSNLSKLRSKNIGFIFQNFNLIPEYTIFENIELPLGYLGVNRENRNSRVHELLQLVGLKDKAYAYPNQLSGGQQQRVAIARALSNKPDIIIADEPTGNLDLDNMELVMNYFKKIQQSNITIIMATHDYNAAKYADKIVKFSELY